MHSGSVYVIAIQNSSLLIWSTNLGDSRSWPCISQPVYSFDIYHTTLQLRTMQLLQCASIQLLVQCNALIVGATTAIAINIISIFGLRNHSSRVGVGNVWLILQCVECVVHSWVVSCITLDILMFSTGCDLTSVILLDTSTNGTITYSRL